MIVEAPRGEAFQIVATQDHATHSWTQCLNTTDGQPSAEDDERGCSSGSETIQSFRMER